MAWTDEQLELLASACCMGWHIKADNFSMAADLVARGYLEVLDGDEGAIRVVGTKSGIKLAFKMKIIADGEHSWSSYGFGERHPAFVKRAKSSLKKDKK